MGAENRRTVMDSPPGNYTDRSISSLWAEERGGVRKTQPDTNNQKEVRKEMSLGDLDRTGRFMH